MCIFKKIRGTGHVVEVYCENTSEKVFYGWNLLSPNLLLKSYKHDDFDHSWVPTVEEVVKLLQPQSYYKLTEDNKHHDASTTRYRHGKIMMWVNTARSA